MAGERGLLPAHPVGGAAAESVMKGRERRWGECGGEEVTYVGVVLGHVLTAKMESEERRREKCGLCYTSVMEGWGMVERKKHEMEKPPPKPSRR